MLIKIVVQGKMMFRMVTSIRELLFGRKGEIHYIGGAEVLPPPLEAEEESRMLELLDTEEREKAKSTLVEHNLRLVVYIAKKFDNTGISVEDLISIGTIGLIKAINTFNTGKNIKLATYASRCIENEILMYLRKNNKVKLEVSIDEPLNVDWDGNELLLSDILGSDEDCIYKNMEEEANRQMLRSAMKHLSAREKVIIDLRFGLNSRDGKEKDTKGSGGFAGNFPVIYITSGKENHATFKK